MVKNLPAMWETWVQSLGWEDSLEKEMATHSSILAWESPRREEPGWLQSMWSMQSQRVRQDGACTHAHPIIQGKMPVFLFLPLFSLTISYPFYLFS